MQAILLALNAAFALIEELIPLIEEKVKTGELSVEEQQKAREAYDSLRARRDALFSGPGWKKS